MAQDLLQKVLDCPRLPSLPAIAMEVIELCRQDDINIRQIAGAISNDPALSTKILKTVNSSYYGLSQPVSTITHALVILGLNSVKTLALGFTLVGSVKNTDEDGFDPNVIWQRSLYSAVGARSIAQRVNVLEHEEAFLGGLLQDLGVIALMQAIGEDYIALLRETAGRHEDLWKLERKELAIDHTQVGEQLARKWKLPDVLVTPIKFHENPDPAPIQLRPMVQTVTLGAKAADILIYERQSSIEDYFRLARQWFNLDQRSASSLLESISEGAQEMARLFDIKTGPVKDAGSILAEANETLFELSLKTQQNASQLEEQNRQLHHKATTDALTGINNRGAFNEFLAEQFEQATGRRRPLSFILFDVDKFKLFNDTHGHLAGDKVLVAIGKLLADYAPQDAFPARFGGEEFCVTIPGMNRREAAQLADQLRQTIQGTPVEINEELILSVTASMGVATYDGATFFKRPEQLIKAADQAVYAAKGAGRNCVRVFTPRVPQTTPA